MAFVEVAEVDGLESAPAGHVGHSDAVVTGRVLLLDAFATSERYLVVIGDHPEVEWQPLSRIQRWLALDPEEQLRRRGTAERTGALRAP